MVYIGIGTVGRVHHILLCKQETPEENSPLWAKSLCGPAHMLLVITRHWCSVDDRGFTHTSLHTFCRWGWYFRWRWLQMRMVQVKFKSRITRTRTGIHDECIYNSVLVLHGNICIRCSVMPKLVLPITGPPGHLWLPQLVPLSPGGTRTRARG